MKTSKLSSGSLTFAMTIGITLAACTNDGAQKRTAKVTVQDLEQRISVNGSIRGRKSSYVTPSYIGYVTDLRVKLGDRVKEGDPLVRIAQTIDQPHTQVYPIRAPFNGIVTQVLRREGEFISETSGSTSVTNGSILRIDDLSEIWLDAAVPETDIAKIKNGLNTVIRPNALPGATYYGTVQNISLSSRESYDRWDRGKVEFPVSILISNPDDKLRPGMSAVADIVAAKAEKVLTLPHEFVHRDGNTYYVVTSKGKEVDVKIGLSNESMVQLISGVSEGDEVRMIDFSDVATGGGSGRRKRASH